jgi:threonine synthase
VSAVQSTYRGYLELPMTGERVEELDAYIPRSVNGATVYPNPVYDLGGLTALPVSDDPGLFRYRAMLPVGDGPVVSLGEGGTPLLPLERLGASLGLGSLHVKDESRGPTWSYKDRLAAVAVTKAVQQGLDTVVVSSTGNHGAAVAAYAARAGIRCVVLTLASVPQAMKTLMQSYGALVVAVAEPQHRWVIMDQAVRERGWAPMSGFVGPPSGSNPFGVEGYKTIAYEIVEQFDGETPDVVVLPVAYGDGLAGLHRGFTDLVELGLVEKAPRLVAAEPFGPYGHALEHGFTSGDTVPYGPTVAFSIGSPMATWQGWNALGLSGGAAQAADDEAIMEAQQRLASSEGLFLEASSAITVAVLPKLVERGVVTADDRVVLLGTSTGLKDVPTTAARQPAVPVIEPTLAALDAALGTVEA